MLSYIRLLPHPWNIVIASYLSPTPLPSTPPSQPESLPKTTNQGLLLIYNPQSVGRLSSLARHLQPSPSLAAHRSRASPAPSSFSGHNNLSALILHMPWTITLQSLYSCYSLCLEDLLFLPSQPYRCLRNCYLCGNSTLVPPLLRSPP